ncbi:MAG: TIGR02147 family protein [Chitinispirillaceae bacterium]
MNNDTQVSLFEYLDYRSFLADFIAAKKRENPHFSDRMMAYRLGCNPGFFNRVLKATRNLSPHYVLKLVDLLKLNAKQKHYFALLVNYNQAKKQIEKDHYFRQLDIFRSSKVKATAVAQHAMYAEWFYVVLRELINIIPCKNLSEETCRLLAKYFDPRVTPDQIRQALAILDDVGMLKRRGNGVFTVKERFITTGMDIPQVVINRVLIQFIDLARFAVDRFSRQERSLSTLTFSVSEKGYEKIREKLDHYRREILSIVNEERDRIDRVYHLNMHLFPVTRAYRGSTR